MVGSLTTPVLSVTCQVKTCQFVTIYSPIDRRDKKFLPSYVEIITCQSALSVQLCSPQQKVHRSAFGLSPILTICGVVKLPGYPPLRTIYLTRRL